MYVSAGCGCSPCGGCSTGCASGNCSTGNCATTTNLAPNEPIAPVPDPKTGSRTIEQRLRAIERELKIVAPTTPETYTPDDFNSVPGPRGTGTGTTIPSRRNNDTQFEMPPRGKATDTEGEMFEENRAEPRSSLKPPINGATNSGTKIDESGSPIPSKSTGDESSTKKPAPGEPIDEGKGQSLRLDSRVTSRAVSPRQRLATPIKPAVVARKPATKLQVDVQPRTANVARY